MGTFKNPDVWKQNLAYQIGDFVLYDGSVYMAIKPVPAGTEMSSDYWYAFAEGAIIPTGEISITENGEVDVKEYATANVNVEGGGGGGDFGPTVLVGRRESVPVVNGYVGISSIISSLTVGNTTIINDIASDGTSVGNPFSAFIAGGISVTTEWQSDYDTCTPYLVTIGECEEVYEGETYTYLGWKSVEPWDGTITKETETGDIVVNRWVFDVPVMDGNDYGIILVMSTDK